MNPSRDLSNTAEQAHRIPPYKRTRCCTTDYIDILKISARTEDFGQLNVRRPAWTVVKWRNVKFRDR